MDGELFNSSRMSFINLIQNASAVLFRKEACLRAGMGDQRMRHCGGWDMWIRICRQGRVCFDAGELNSHRSHPRTTRAIGDPVVLASEMLACRLEACMGSASPQSHPISLLQLLYCLFSPRGLQVVHAFRSIDFCHIAGLLRITGPCLVLPVWGVARGSRGIGLLSRLSCQGYKNHPWSIAAKAWRSIVASEGQAGSIALIGYRRLDPR